MKQNLSMIFFRRFRKHISIFITSMFLFTMTGMNNIAAAVADTVPVLKVNVGVNDILLATENGRILESFKGAGDNTVVCIQDLHCHKEVQDNIADILKILKETYKKDFNNIFVEGSWEKLDLDLVKAMPDKYSIKAKMIDKLVSVGYMTGAEKYAVNDLKTQVYGIEDKDIYKKDSNLLIDSFQDRERALRIILLLKEKLEQLKVRKFTKEQKIFSDKMKGYEDRKINVINYVKILQKYSNQLGINFELEAPNLAKILLLLDYRLQIGELNKVKDEAKTLENMISKNLGKVEKEKLNELKNENNTRYYLYLKKIVDQNNLNMKDFAFLNLYFKYLELSASINTNLLVDEERRLKDKIYGFLIMTDEQKELVQFEKVINFYENFINNSVTSKEATDFMANEKEYAYFINNFLNNNSSYLIWAYSVQKQISTLNRAINRMKEFYQFAEERNNVLVANTIDKRNKISVMVLGGYHTDGVTQILRAMDMSYVLISPNVTKEYDNKIYENRLLDQAGLVKENNKIQKIGNDKLALVSLYQAYGLKEEVLRQRIEAIVGKDAADTLKIKDMEKDALREQLLAILRENLRAADLDAEQLKDFFTGMNDVLQEIKPADRAATDYSVTVDVEAGKVVIMGQTIDFSELIENPAQKLVRKADKAKRSRQEADKAKEKAVQVAPAPVRAEARREILLPMSQPTSGAGNNCLFHAAMGERVGGVFTDEHAAEHRREFLKFIGGHGGIEHLISDRIFGNPDLATIRQTIFEGNMGDDYTAYKLQPDEKREAYDRRMAEPREGQNTLQEELDAKLTAAEQTRLWRIILREQILQLFIGMAGIDPNLRGANGEVERALFGYVSENVGRINREEREAALALEGREARVIDNETYIRDHLDDVWSKYVRLNQTHQTSYLDAGIDAFIIAHLFEINIQMVFGSEYRGFAEAPSFNYNPRAARRVRINNSLGNHFKRVEDERYVFPAQPVEGGVVARPVVISLTNVDVDQAAKLASESLVEISTPENMEAYYAIFIEALIQGGEVAEYAKAKINFEFMVRCILNIFDVASISAEQFAEASAAIEQIVKAMPPTTDATLLGIRADTSVGKKYSFVFAKYALTVLEKAAKAEDADLIQRLKKELEAAPKVVVVATPSVPVLAPAVVDMREFDRLYRVANEAGSRMLATGGQVRDITYTPVVDAGVGSVRKLGDPIPILDGRIITAAAKLKEEELAKYATAENLGLLQTISRESERQAIDLMVDVIREAYNAEQALLAEMIRIVELQLAPKPAAHAFLAGEAIRRLRTAVGDIADATFGQLAIGIQGIARTIEERGAEGRAEEELRVLYQNIARAITPEGEVVPKIRFVDTAVPFGFVRVGGSILYSNGDIAVVQRMITDGRFEDFSGFLSAWEIRVAREMRAREFKIEAEMTSYATAQTIQRFEDELIGRIETESAGYRERYESFRRYYSIYWTDDTNGALKQVMGNGILRLRRKLLRDGQDFADIDAKLLEVLGEGVRDRVIALETELAAPGTIPARKLAILAELKGIIAPHAERLSGPMMGRMKVALEHSNAAKKPIPELTSLIDLVNDFDYVPELHRAASQEDIERTDTSYQSYETDIELTGEWTRTAEDELIAGHIGVSCVFAGAGTRFSGGAANPMYRVDLDTVVRREKERIEGKLEDQRSLDEKAFLEAARTGHIDDMGIAERQLFQYGYMMRKLYTERGRDIPRDGIRFPLIIHVSGEHWEEIRESIIRNNFYGLDPAYIMFRFQTYDNSYYVDEAGREFEGTDALGTFPRGHGELAMALYRAGAFRINGAGVATPITGTIDEQFEEWGVQNVYIRRVNDMTMWTPMALDPKVLGYEMMRVSQGAGMVYELMENTQGIKGGNAVVEMDPVTGRERMYLIEGFALAGPQGAQLKATIAPTSPFNKFNCLVNLKRSRQTVLDIVPAVRTRVVDGVVRVGLDCATGDQTQSIVANAAFFKQSGEAANLRDLKDPSVKMLTLAVQMMNVQESQRGFGEFVRSVRTINTAAVLGEAVAERARVAALTPTVGLAVIGDILRQVIGTAIAAFTAGMHAVFGLLTSARAAALTATANQLREALMVVETKIVATGDTTMTEIDAAIDAAKPEDVLVDSKATLKGAVTGASAAAVELRVIANDQVGLGLMKKDGAWEITARDLEILMMMPDYIRVDYLAYLKKHEILEASLLSSGVATDHDGVSVAQDAHNKTVAMLGATEQRKWERILVLYNRMVVLKQAGKVNLEAIAALEEELLKYTDPESVGEVSELYEAQKRFGVESELLDAQVYDQEIVIETKDDTTLEGIEAKFVGDKWKGKTVVLRGDLAAGLNVEGLERIAQIAMQNGGRFMYVPGQAVQGIIRDRIAEPAVQDLVRRRIVSPSAYLSMSNAIVMAPGTVVDAELYGIAKALYGDQFSESNATKYVNVLLHTFYKVELGLETDPVIVAKFTPERLATLKAKLVAQAIPEAKRVELQSLPLKQFVVSGVEVGADVWKVVVDPTQAEADKKGLRVEKDQIMSFSMPAADKVVLKVGPSVEEATAVVLETKPPVILFLDDVTFANAAVLEAAHAAGIMIDRGLLAQLGPIVQRILLPFIAQQRRDRGLGIEQALVADDVAAVKALASAA